MRLRFHPDIPSCAPSSDFTRTFPDLRPEFGDFTRTFLGRAYRMHRCTAPPRAVDRGGDQAEVVARFCEMFGGISDSGTGG